VALSPEAIENYIKDHLAQVAKEKGIALPEIDGQSNLLDLGVLDSLGFVQMLMGLETEFGLEMDLTEMDPEEFTSLQGLVATALKTSQAA
jgi:acyl carrier protein